MAETVKRKVEVEEDDPLELLLSTQQNVYIGSFIAHEACKAYCGAYKRKWIPLSFLECFFNEYKLYGKAKSVYLDQFYSKYSPTELPEIIEHYSENVYSLIVGRLNRNDELCYRLGNKYNGLYIDLDDPGVLGLADPKLFKSLAAVREFISSQDEIISIVDIYENFMIRKVVQFNNRKRKILEQNKEKENPSPKVEKAITRDEPPALSKSEQSEPKDKMLVGAASKIPNQSGKVTRLFFPKLSLPSPYPIQKDKSRINSDFRVKHFMQSAKQISLINQKKFNAIKYSTGFIGKRKAAAKPAKRKFDFDF